MCDPCSKRKIRDVRIDETYRSQICAVLSSLMNLAIIWKPSLHADSTDSLKRSEVPPPVECVQQQHNACPESCVVPRLEEPDLICGKRSLLFSFSLID